MVKKKRYGVKLTKEQSICSKAMAVMLVGLYNVTRDQALKEEIVPPLEADEDSDDYFLCLSNLYQWADVLPNNTSDMFYTHEWNAFIVSVEQIKELVNRGTKSISEIWEQIQSYKDEPLGEFESYEKVSEPDGLCLDNFVYYILKDCCDNMFGHPDDFYYGNFDYGEEYFHILTPQIVEKCHHILDNSNVKKANLQGNLGKSVFILKNGYPADNDEILASDDEDEVYIETEDFLLEKYKSLPEYLYVGEVFTGTDESSYNSYFFCSEFFDRVILAYRLAKMNHKSDEEFLDQFRNMYNGQDCF